MKKLSYFIQSIVFVFFMNCTSEEIIEPTVEEETSFMEEFEQDEEKNKHITGRRGMSKAKFRQELHKQPNGQARVRLYKKEVRSEIKWIKNRLNALRRSVNQNSRANKNGSIDPGLANGLDLLSLTMDYYSTANGYPNGFGVEEAADVEGNSDLVLQTGQQLENSLQMNSAIQSLYLQYSELTEALRIVSEAVQKGIDITENERNVSQEQE